jgi:hypothetical protein
MCGNKFLKNVKQKNRKSTELYVDLDIYAKEN